MSNNAREVCSFRDRIGQGGNQRFCELTAAARSAPSRIQAAIAP
jgi:hypothetical protein